jgi:DNA-directed RNA polymerase specialized sigma24 family protein
MRARGNRIAEISEIMGVKRTAVYAALKRALHVYKSAIETLRAEDEAGEIDLSRELGDSGEK